MGLFSGKNPADEGKKKKSKPRPEGRLDIMGQLGEKKALRKGQAPETRQSIQLRIGQKTLESVVASHTYFRTHSYLCDPEFEPLLWMLLADINGLSTDTDESGRSTLQLKRGSILELPTLDEITLFDPQHIGKIDYSLGAAYSEDEEDDEDEEEEDEEEEEEDDDDGDGDDDDVAEAVENKLPDPEADNSDDKDENDDEVEDEDEDEDEYEDKVEHDNAFNDNSTRVIASNNTESSSFGPPARTGQLAELSPQGDLKAGGTPAIPAGAAISAGAALSNSSILPPNQAEELELLLKKYSSNPHCTQYKIVRRAYNAIRQKSPAFAKTREAQATSQKVSTPPIPPKLPSPAQNILSTDFVQTTIIKQNRPGEEPISPHSSTAPTQGAPTQAALTQAPTPAAQNRHPNRSDVYSMRGEVLELTNPDRFEWRKEYVQIDLADNARIRTYISPENANFAIVLQRLENQDWQAAAAYEFQSSEFRLVKTSLSGAQHVTRISLAYIVAVQLARNDLTRNWKTHCEFMT